MKTTLHIINGEDFLERIDTRMDDVLFKEMLKVNGLWNLLIDKGATKQYLGVKSDSIIDKYIKVGKDDICGTFHKLPVNYLRRKPRFKLGDIIEFKEKIR